MAENQGFWLAVNTATSSLVSGLIILLNNYLNKAQPASADLAVQKLENRKKFKLAKLRYQSNLERLNSRYQHRKAELDLEYENLQKQEALFLARRNLEVGLGNQSISDSSKEDIKKAKEDITETATNLVGDLKSQGEGLVNSLFGKVKK